MDHSRRQLRRATIVFWILLVYIFAFLLWWMLSLEQQNIAIHELKKGAIRHAPGTTAYANEWDAIKAIQRRNSVKHILEGVTFLLLIFFGAVYIYRLVRRQFALQLQQQNFVMAVTHELKTPISVVRLNLETVQKHQLDEPRRKKLMGITVQETMRLDTLINNILISSQLDVNAYHTAKEDLNFSELVHEVLDGFSARYPERHLHKKVQEEVDIKGDALLLKLLVSNLLENAQKYSPAGAPITCSLKKAGRALQLEVSDEGTGIEEHERKKVF
ncbi:MAG: histidine kinase dimerization/phospho-acceptor domain-containing protein, partial [Chitinophagaceae bacterium]